MFLLHGFLFNFLHFNSDKHEIKNKIKKISKKKR